MKEYVCGGNPGRVLKVSAGAMGRRRVTENVGNGAGVPSPHKMAPPHAQVQWPVLLRRQLK
jgi:hypothetical protein